MVETLPMSFKEWYGENVDRLPAWISMQEVVERYDRYVEAYQQEVDEGMEDVDAE